MNKKPQVFPSTDKAAVQAELFQDEKMEAVGAIYDSSATPTDTPEGHQDAVEVMRQRTELQMKLKQAALDKNIEQTKSYNDQMEGIMAYTPPPKVVAEKTEEPIQNKKSESPAVQEPKKQAVSVGKNPSSISPEIIALSQPDFNTPYDVIPVPSEGKAYRSKKSSFRVAYLTAADEDILTSPNLLASGQFLEILINRKLLEQDIRYKDLVVGDRNAIMLWLRATSYGHMYPVTLLDENDNPFETEINLNELKTKKLGVELDKEGLVDYTLPLSKDDIKFKFLTVGDIDELQEIIEADTAKGLQLNRTNTYKLKRHIVEVNGNRDRTSIDMFVDSMRVGDSATLRKYIDEVESGVELEITVGTPGGGTIETFLPLNVNFFWPDIRV